MRQLLDILQVSDWIGALRVLIDLALVYYFIYRILLLIKGTRAAQIVIGLLLVFALFAISSENALDLRVTNWFLDKFIVNFVIIAVIIFQADIRRALAKAGGRTSIFSLSRGIEDASVLEEVIKAAQLLSKSNLGALMVIEREADLAYLTQDGIEIDAIASKDLLYSLFLPEHQNPLHDGAVIIQKGRIAAAGCVLPLTNNPRVDRSFGTRHRAGIGLSEEADAAVVIVSEETGTISIAHDGEILRDLEVTTMREILQRLFRVGGKESADLGELGKRLSEREELATPSARDPEHPTPP
jgi:uncharacterized protein (TIGR00159 family)